jgi:hypothetical protein
LRVGADKGVDRAELERTLKEKVRRAVELTPTILFEEPSAIDNPAETLKAKRVVDTRPQG